MLGRAIKARPGYEYLLRAAGKPSGQPRGQNVQDYQRETIELNTFNIFKVNNCPPQSVAAYLTFPIGPGHNASQAARWGTVNTTTNGRADVDAGTI